MSKRSRQDFEQNEGGMGMELLIADAEAFDEENESAVMEFAAMKEAEAMAELVEKANVVLEGTTLSLTLVAKPCVLHDIVLHEKIDENLLNQLIHSDLLRETFADEFRKKIFENEKNQLQRYTRLVHKGYAHVNYKKQDGSPFGRSNPVGGLGLFNIRRQLRHTLTKGQYVDWDIKNCHPTLLLQICKANGIPCSHLENYVVDRENALAAVARDYGVNREAAKELFIILMYLGSFESWAKTNKVQRPIMLWITKFVDEVRGIAKIIREANPVVVEVVKKRKAEQGKADYNLDASVCAIFLQENECLVLEVVYMLCLESKLIPDNVCVLCADGLMIEAKYSTPDLSGKFAAAVREQLGFNLEFTTKALDEGYDKVDEHIIFNMHKTGLSTGSCADYFKMIYGHKFKHVDGKTYYYNGVYWAIDEKPFSYLHVFIDHTFHDHLLHKTLKGMEACELRIFERNAAKASSVVTVDASTAALALAPTPVCAPTPVPLPLAQSGGALLVVPSEPVMHKSKKSKTSKLDKMEKAIAALKAEETEESDPDKEEHKVYLDLLHKHLPLLRSVSARSSFIDDIQHALTDDTLEFDVNPYLFAFTNRVLDLRTNNWQATPHPLDYISLTTGYPYNSNENSRLKTELDVILRQIITNPVNFAYYIRLMASGMCGEQIPMIMVANGGGGNGKSVLNQLGCASLGNYSYVLPAICLQTPIQCGANPQLACMHKKRFVLTSEPADGRTICTSVLKDATGNKRMAVRNLYEKKVGIRMDLTLFLECNAKPLLDTVDDGVNRRLRMAGFDSKFLDEVPYAQAAQAGLPNIFPLNTRCNLDEFRVEYRQAFFEVLREHFKFFVKDGVCIMKMPNQPEEFRELTSDYLATSDDMWGWFLSKYEKTETSVDTIIPIKDLFKAFSFSEYFQLMNKADKRNNNLKRFTDRCNANIFLAQVIKRRNQRVGGVPLTADSVVGWVVKVVVSDPMWNGSDNL